MAKLNQVTTFPKAVEIEETTGDLESTLFRVIDKSGNVRFAVDKNGTITGVSGGGLLFGSGVPGAGLGSDGNAYIDTANGKLYRKASGAWAEQVDVVISPETAPLAQSGQNPAQEPVIPGTKSVGTMAVTMRADAVIPSAGLYGWLGDGSDGAAVFDGSATPAGTTKVSSTLYRLDRDVFYTSVSISSGVEIQTKGLNFFCRGDITVPSGTGTITAALAQVSGTNESVGVGSGANQPYLNGQRNITLGIGARGPSGGTGAGTPASGINPVVDYNAVGDTAGGTGGAGSNGAGGTGNPGVNNKGHTLALRRFPVAVFGLHMGVDSLNAVQNPMVILHGGNAGGSGGGDGTNSGGAGGSGGGICIVNAKRVIGTLNVSAPGARGGIPTTGNCGGGGGGTGGMARLNAIDLTGWTGTITAAGGAGGAGVGSGTAGTAGGAGVAIATTWV